MIIFKYNEEPDYEEQDVVTNQEEGEADPYYLNACEVFEAAACHILIYHGVNLGTATPKLFCFICWRILLLLVFDVVEENLDEEDADNDVYDQGEACSHAVYILYYYLLAILKGSDSFSNDQDIKYECQNVENSERWESPYFNEPHFFQARSQLFMRGRIELHIDLSRLEYEVEYRNPLDSIKKGVWNLQCYVDVISSCELFIVILIFARSKPYSPEVHYEPSREAHSVGY